MFITGRNEVVAKVIFLHLNNFAKHWYHFYVYYRPQRSCGQGNIFTPVCHSVHRGGGGGIPQGTEADPPDQAHPPPRTRHHPPDQTHHPPGPGTPPRTRHNTTPPQTRHPPGKQTPAYGLRAAGTHPTGMHSCLNENSLNLKHIIQQKISWPQRC